MFKKKRSRSKVLKYKSQHTTFSKRKRSFKRKKTSRYKKPILQLIAVVTVVLSLIYIIYFSTLFNIKKIEVKSKNSTESNNKITQIYSQLTQIV